MLHSLSSQVSYFSALIQAYDGWIYERRNSHDSRTKEASHSASRQREKLQRNF